MTKTLFFTAILGVISFTSCKKDYDCTCTTTSGGTQVLKRTFTIPDVTKSDAETACKNSEETLGTAITACEFD